MLARRKTLNKIYKFKNQTGVTPIQFLTRFRLQYSKQLLSTTDMRINEIAFAVGFYDAYYFSNAFKKYLQRSPSISCNSIDILFFLRYNFMYIAKLFLLSNFYFGVRLCRNVDLRGG